MSRLSGSVVHGLDTAQAYQTLCGSPRFLAVTEVHENLVDVAAHEKRAVALTDWRPSSGVNPICARDYHGRPWPDWRALNSTIPILRIIDETGYLLFNEPRVSHSQSVGVGLGQLDVE